MFKIRNLVIFVVVLAVLSSFVSSNCFDISSYGGEHFYVVGCVQGTSESLLNTHKADRGVKYCVNTEGSSIYGSDCTDTLPGSNLVCCEWVDDETHYGSRFVPEGSCDGDITAKTVDAAGHCINLVSCVEDDDCYTARSYFKDSIQLCTTDDDCILQGSFCQEGVCEIVPAEQGYQYCTDEFCQIKNCVDDNDCPEGDFCKNKLCTGIYDKDGDGLPGSFRYGAKEIDDNIKEANPGMYDCDDKTSLCNLDCVSDADGDNHPDCMDVQIDADGDGFARDDSVRLIPSHIWEGLDENYRTVLSENGYGIYKSDLSDDAFVNQMSDLEWQASILLLALAGKYEFDCNDENKSINPGEEETCNLIDDNCDGTVDECDIDGEQCVYNYDQPGCYALDSDHDGFKNTTFGCSDCTDCNDDDSSINPTASDTADADRNCNGVIEGADTDGDGIPDSYTQDDSTTNLDRCPSQGMTHIIDPFGCWFSTATSYIADYINIPGWSTEP